VFAIAALYGLNPSVVTWQDVPGAIAWRTPFTNTPDSIRHV
jgi:hypothetical protein